MKTRIATLLSITFLTLTLTIPLKAQNNDFSIDKNFEWDGESKTETIFVKIKDNSSNMLINLTGIVKTGKLEVNIYNPDGEKIPGFLLIADESVDNSNNSISVSTSNENNTVVTSSSGSSSGSSSSTSNSTSINTGKRGTSTFTTTNTSGIGSKGVMSKVLSDPLPGKWKIVVSAKKLKGELEVSINQD